MHPDDRSLLDVVVDTRPADPPAWCHGGSDFGRLEPRCTVRPAPHRAHVVEGPRP